MTKPKSKAAAESNGLVDALAQISFLIMASLSKVGSQNDLSLTQLRVLGILRDRQPRMASLAARLGLEKSTMSGLVDRGEKRGLLARAASEEDGRAIHVCLTKEGAKLAEQLYAQVQEVLAPLTSRLGPADQRRLQDLLEQMIDSFAD